MHIQYTPKKTYLLLSLKTLISINLPANTVQFRIRYEQVSRCVPVKHSDGYRRQAGEQQVKQHQVHLINHHLSRPTIEDLVPDNSIL